jgi:UDP-N-acetylglucosamine--N-acetylmuramyl-(pentapeptide) pyrophosphoryl-undecaprenol N-acetylglucosamine transferase
MPALAVADALQRAAPDIEPVMVGAARGVEARLLPTRDFRFHLLPSEPIYRRQWWRNARWPVVGVRLLRELHQLFQRESPVAVLGTGGYASGPVVWAGVRRGLPGAIQEQNAFPGLASRLLAGRVRHIYLGVPEAAGRLRPGRETQVFDTGNPIVPPDPQRRMAALARFGLHGAEPVLLVTGGSQGSLALNRAVAAWLDAGGASGWTVLWVTGRGSHREFVGRHRPPQVQVVDFLDPMADGYAVAELVVSRAGMMTVAEICAWGLPSVLIPLPTAAADHQTGNAGVMERAGAARMLSQSVLEADGLAPTLGPLLLDGGQRQRLASAALIRGRPDAVDTIVERLLTLLPDR